MSYFRYPFYFVVSATIALVWLVILPPAQVCAQVTIFHDDFSFDPAANGWVEVTGGTGTANPDIHPSVPPGQAVIEKVSGGLGRAEGTVTRVISTLGYQNIETELVAFQSATQFEGGAVGLNNTDNLAILIDTGGGFVPLFERSGVWGAPGGTGFSDGTTGPGQTVPTSSGTIILPAAAANNPNLGVQIRGWVWAAAEDYFVDDFTLRGTLIVAPPPVPPRSTPAKASVLAVRVVPGVDREPAVVFIEDMGAIQSLIRTGLPMVGLTGEANLIAAQASNRDINERLFRLRARAGRRSAAGRGGAKTRRGDRGSSALSAKAMAFLSGGDSEEPVVFDDRVTLASLSPIAGFAPIPVSVSVGARVPAEEVLVYEDGLELEIFSGADYGGIDQDRLSDFAGLKSETYSGTIGAELRPTPSLALGLAWTYLENDTEFGSDLGSVQIEGHQAFAYGSFVGERFYADLLYGHGWFEDEIRRHTGLGSVTLGEPGATAHTVEFHAGYYFTPGQAWVTGPFVAADATTGTVDGYRERNGGSANLVVGERDFDSLISSVGWQVSRRRSWAFGDVVPQLRVAWDHENEGAVDGVDVALATSPFTVIRGSEVSRSGGYRTRANGVRAGRDYLNAGAGVRFYFGETLSLGLEYEGHFFRRSRSAHFGSLMFAYSF